VTIAVFSILLLAVSGFLLWGALSIDHASSRHPRSLRVNIRVTGASPHLEAIERLRDSVQRRIDQDTEGEEWKDA
jgi:hypothetical protein